MFFTENNVGFCGKSGERISVMPFAASFFLYHWKGVGFPLIQNHSAGAHSDGQELHKKHIKL